MLRTASICAGHNSFDISRTGICPIRVRMCLCRAGSDYDKAIIIQTNKHHVICLCENALINVKYWGLQTCVRPLLRRFLIRGGVKRLTACGVIL